jgi:hypothetical protein
MVRIARLFADLDALIEVRARMAEPSKQEGREIEGAQNGQVEPRSEAG